MNKAGAGQGPSASELISRCIALEALIREAVSLNGSRKSKPAKKAKR